MCRAALSLGLPASLRRAEQLADVAPQIRNLALPLP